MHTTMELLDAALSIEPPSFWHKELNLGRSTLHTARSRGHLSPAIAGAMAEKLGKPVESWVYIAAMESEKDSACKERMRKRAANFRSL
jgi:hypothetical protein